MGQTDYKTPEQLIRGWQNTPMQIYREKDELTQLQERWTSLIRGHGFQIVQQDRENKMTKPDLFDIANEIDAFFTGLKSLKK